MRRLSEMPAVRLLSNAMAAVGLPRPKALVTRLLWLPAYLKQRYGRWPTVVRETRYGLQLCTLRDDRKAIRRWAEGYAPYAECRLFLRAASEADVVIDAGANYGEFSIPAAARSNGRGRFVLFEANRKIADCLEISRERNGIPPSRLIIEHLALHSREGETVLHIAPNASGCSSLKDDVPMIQRQGGWKVRQAVPMTSLDVYFRDRPSPARLALKIDVEGLDFEVLKGAAALLAGAQEKLVLIEMEPGRMPPAELWEAAVKPLGNCQVAAIGSRTEEPCELVGSLDDVPAFVTRSRGELNLIFFTRAFEEAVFAERRASGSPLAPSP